jgi:hypothetical protein
MDLENILTSAQKARLREIMSGAGGKKDTDSKDKAASAETKK